ncbi:MAG: hypothetical protein CVT65_13970 [Actinobacteria bacterium HGW-Actinobacteria-5]|nr:MAG: hypothetical protein CVT65_13970 [Actinobacteria bacterium HGW-Actinobacteria-5]
MDVVNDLLMLTSARTFAATGDGLRRRQAAGLSLREVAAAVGISPTTLWRWEKGQRTPRGRAAIAWACLLDELGRKVRTR